MESLNYIIAGCKNNEHKWQKTLYEQYYGFALKVAFRYIYKYEKAVDVVNDGFVKVFRNFIHFNAADGNNTEKILLGWIKRIIVNTAIDELRKQNNVPETGEMPEGVWQQPDMAQLADEKLVYKDLILQLKKMPPSYRTVFNMHVIDGYSHQEIATHMGISIGTSKSSLAKAKAFLQKLLNKGFSEVEYATSK